MNQMTSSRQVMLFNKDLLSNLFNEDNPIHIHIARLFSEYNHPLFPPHWLSKPIVIVQSAEEWRGYFYQAIKGKNDEGILSYLLEKGVKIVAGVISEGEVHPWEYSIVDPLGKTMDLIELYEKRDKGLIQVWDESVFSADIIHNLYQLWMKLGTRENRTTFLFKLLKGISTEKIPFTVLLDNKATINITGPLLVDYPSNTLKVTILQSGAGELKGLNTRTTNNYVWLGRSYNPSHECVVEGGFILFIFLMSRMNNFNSTVIDGLSLNMTSIWKTEETYGVKSIPGSTNEAISTHVIKPIGTTVIDPVVSTPGIGFINIPSTDDGNPSSSELMRYLLEKGIPVVPHKYAQYNEYCIMGKGAQAMGIGLRVKPSYIEQYPDATVYNTPLSQLEILSFNADEKSREGAKFFNRTTGHHKATTAEGTIEHPLVPSHLILETDDGDVRLYGIEVKNVQFTNSRLGNGSGVAVINGDKPPLSYSIRKVIKGQIPSYLIPKEEKEKLLILSRGTGKSSLQVLAEHIKRKIISLIEKGHIYGPNEVVLTIWDKYPEYRTTIIETPSNNLQFKLLPLNEDSIRVNLDRDGVKGDILITLETESIVNDYQVKCRVPGGKFTTVPQPLIFEDDRDWSLFLPYEAIKGRLMLLYMYANHIWEKYQIECRYISNEGILRFNQPLILEGIPHLSIDLTTTDNIFEDWVRSNTELVWVRQYISTHIINRLYKEEPHLIQLIGEDKPNADIQLIEEVEGGYYIREVLQVLTGTIHVRIEITSPREYLTKQGFTLEQLLVIEAICPELALAINQGAERIHEGVKALISFSKGRLISELGGIQKLTLGEMKEIITTYIRQEEILFTKSSDLLYICEDLFPSGVILVDKDKQLTYLHFGLLIKYGSISGSGTILTGLIGDVTHLLRVLIDEDLTPVKENIYSRYLAVIRLDMVTWSKTIQGGTKGSSKVLARLGATSDICTGIKVKTSHAPELEHKDGLPIFIFHSQCESIKRLRLKQGDYIAVGRVPMSSLIFGIAIIDDNIGDIAHVICSPEVWAQGNQGDSDGDAVATLNLNRLRTGRIYDEGKGRYITTYFQTSKEEMKLWNESILMMGGLDDSFSGFINGKSKWTSKLIDSTRTIEGYTPSRLSPIVTRMDAEEYVLLAEKVASHYTYDVGNGYGIYSVLCLLTANLLSGLRKNILSTQSPWKDGVIYDRNNLSHITRLHQLIHQYPEVNHIQQALMITCRYIYEELGLGGYTEKRSQVFQVIRAVTNGEQVKWNIALITDKETGQKYISMRELSDLMKEEGDINYEELNGLNLLSYLLMNRHDEEALSITKMILEANSLRLLFGVMEKKESAYRPSNPFSIYPNRCEIAGLMGAYRRLGQGDYIRGNEGKSTYEIVGELMMRDKVTGILRNYIQSDIMWYYLSNIKRMLEMFLSFNLPNP